MLDIQIMKNHQEIRKVFCEKFVLSKEAFEIQYKEWIEFARSKGHELKYEEVLLWDKMPQYQPISFDRALDFLRDLNHPVYAMSEPEKPHEQGFTLDGTTHRGVVIQADSAALAELMGYEWYEDWRLMEEDCYLADAILPGDLYVFDPSMEHLLVFTHEHDFWDLVRTQPMVAAKSRYCMCHGFELPPEASYEELKAAFTSRQKDGTITAVECSYSLPGYYRAFTVCKQTMSNQSTSYWFDHAPDDRYTSVEELEVAKAFCEESLLSVSQKPSVRFEIHSVAAKDIL